jgi:hypothetical protein
MQPSDHGANDATGFIITAVAGHIDEGAGAHRSLE